MNYHIYQKVSLEKLFFYYILLKLKYKIFINMMANIDWLDPCKFTREMCEFIKNGPAKRESLLSPLEAFSYQFVNLSILFPKWLSLFFSLFLDNNDNIMIIYLINIYIIKFIINVLNNISFLFK